MGMRKDEGKYVLRRWLVVSNCRQAGADPEITPEMIEAGFRVLCSSGIADEYSRADKTLVAEIFVSMWREQSARQHESARRSLDRAQSIRLESPE